MPVLSFHHLLALLSVVASAAALVLHESRAGPPTGFSSKGAAPADQSITLRVALTANNLAGLESKLMSISTPGSADFRQWLSADEVKSFVQPSAATVAAFNAFAKSNGLQTSVISPNEDWVSFTTTVGHANQLFGAAYESFSHSDMAHPLTRTLSLSLPEELVGHVDTVHPTTSFDEPDVRLAPKVIPALEKRAVPESCNSTINPACLQELYGIPTTPATEKSNTLLVTGYVGQYAQSADISAFLKALRPDIDPATTFTLEILDEGTDPQSPSDAGDEANLDVEYTIGIATGVPVTFLSVGGPDSDLATVGLDTITFLAGVDNPPSVMTTSYAVTESVLSSSLATCICNGYMALGARGISVIFASGDGGVRGNHDDPSECANNTFLPVFPAACPFVTAVGSTVGVQPEVAINYTGGGFSNTFARPSYQSVVVPEFLETVPADFPGIFNKNGRGYPDVAVQGVNFQIVNGGESELISGTSASTPTFASIIALINDRLVAAGKPVLGFLNPFIYSTASGAFTDITVGKNTGFVCPEDTTVAFTAATGWDALTGFGTPVFSKLLAAAMA